MRLHRLLLCLVLFSIETLEHPHDLLDVQGLAQMGIHAGGIALFHILPKDVGRHGHDGDVPGVGIVRSLLHQVQRGNRSVQGRAGIPQRCHERQNRPAAIKDWRKEQQSLTAAKYAACERYYALQDEVRSVEQLRKGAENIMRQEVQERQSRRAQGVEL